MLLPSLKMGKNYKIFMALSLRPEFGICPQVYLGQTKLVSQHLSCSYSSQYAIFSQSLVQIDTHILMKFFEDYIFILYFGSLGFV